MEKERIEKQVMFYRNYGSRLQAEIERQENILRENVITAEAIRCLEKKNILAPIGSGAYIKAKIIDTDTIVVGVGGGYFIEKDKEKTLDLLKQRTEGLTKNIEEMGRGLEKIIEKLKGLKEESEK